jgi:4-hydroxy-tetrahydrodipicolinate reductase
MEPIRLAVSGARGRMGKVVAELAAADPRFAVVRLLEAKGHPDLGRAVAFAPGRELPVEEALGGGAEAVVDFSSPEGFRARLVECVRARAAFVSGTTGLTQADEDLLVDASAEIPVLHAPNLSLGVEALCRAADALARCLPRGYDVEVVEIHHNRKADAPSGTALRIVRVLGEALGGPHGLVHGRQGRPGPRRPEEIGLHAVRGGDVVGEHTVHFLGPGERLELTHRCTDRSVFARGALHAAARIARASPRRYAVADLLPENRGAGENR